MRLIVGLGNPGYEYHLTPHNLGFMAIDRLGEACGKSLTRREAQALTASTELAGEHVVLAKPQTYMNLSGLAVARLLQNYELAPRDLLVLVDEINLPLGMLRVKPRGSAGGHNGLKSIIGAIEADDFIRVRMGVQPDRPVEDYVSYLLRPFRPAETKLVADMVDQAGDAIRVIISEGLQKAMNRFNRRVPPPES
ncbi:MAG: aminoacyl-tRNA hydrolase [Acidobacteriota bacterium]|jgi:PTH1 family peptidyl-tRNA hydrolase|nr:aminoacyl-tRNA hydrolase [Acidobacteriota bacterium]